MFLHVTLVCYLACDMMVSIFLEPCSKTYFNINLSSTFWSCLRFPTHNFLCIPCFSTTHHFLFIHLNNIRWWKQTVKLFITKNAECEPSNGKVCCVQTLPLCSQIISGSNMFNTEQKLIIMILIERSGVGLTPLVQQLQMDLLYQRLIMRMMIDEYGSLIEG